ncbi:MAG: Gfa-like protein [Caulobacter sp.]|nr:Gfa-like protein [Caulobacter sp.]
MSEAEQTYTGGCLCGAVRYEAVGAPLFTGHCYCADCRKASGSGFIPFLAFASAAVRFSGQTLQFRSRSFRGGEAVRNSCPVCGGLVFGGVVGEDSSHTLYAGSLDDPSLFHPKVAIFARDRPAWAIIPPGLTVFDTMPG